MLITRVPSVYLVMTEVCLLTKPQFIPMMLLVRFRSGDSNNCEVSYGEGAKYRHAGE